MSALRRTAKSNVVLLPKTALLSSMRMRPILSLQHPSMLWTTRHCPKHCCVLLSRQPVRATTSILPTARQLRRFKTWSSNSTTFRLLTMWLISSPRHYSDRPLIVKGQDGSKQARAGANVGDGAGVWERIINCLAHVSLNNYSAWTWLAQSWASFSTSCSWNLLFVVVCCLVWCVVVYKPWQQGERRYICLDSSDCILVCIYGLSSPSCILVCIHVLSSP